MASRDEGAYSLEICNRGATTPEAPPRRKTAWDIFKTRSDSPQCDSPGWSAQRATPGKGPATNPCIPFPTLTDGTTPPPRTAAVAKPKPQRIANNRRTGKPQDPKTPTTHGAATLSPSPDFSVTPVQHAARRAM